MNNKLTGKIKINFDGKGSTTSKSNAELGQDVKNMYALLSSSLADLRENIGDDFSDSFTIRAYQNFLQRECAKHLEFFEQKYGSEIKLSLQHSLAAIHDSLFVGEVMDNMRAQIGTIFPDAFPKKSSGIFDRFKKTYKDLQTEEDEFALYSKGVMAGWAVGILIAVMADRFGVKGPWAEGFVRLIAGSGDSIGGMCSLLEKRIRQKAGEKGSQEISQAETFALGSIIGTAVGPLAHALSEVFIGSGTTNDIGRGALVASMYSNADNWGGALASLVKSIKENGLKEGTRAFLAHPFQVANLTAVIGLLGIDLTARGVGVIPETNLEKGIEGVLLNTDSTIASLAYLTFKTKRGTKTPEEKVDSATK